MKCVITGLIALIIGGAGGYTIGKKISSKKYRQIADSEIDSVKKELTEYYEEKLKGKAKPKKAVTEKKDDKPKKKNNLVDRDSIDYDQLKEDKKTYVNYVKSYSNDTNVKEEKPEVLAEKIGLPYIISDVEYSEGDYNTETLHWYKDGVLCDDDYNVIKDITGTVGDEALNSFGIYATDAVYVRNDQYKIDYEILLEDDEYNRIAPKEPIKTFPGYDE